MYKDKRPDRRMLAVVRILSAQHEIRRLPLQRRVWGEISEVYHRPDQLPPHGAKETSITEKTARFVH